MTCKECYHYDACGGYLPTDIDSNYVLDLCKKGKSDEIPDIEDRCSEFKDKSLIVELPCKVGDTVYFLYSKSVKKGIIKRIRPFVYSQKDTSFMLDVEITYIDPFYNDGRIGKSTQIMSFDKDAACTIAYRTKEEAEKALKTKEGE